MQCDINDTMDVCKEDIEERYRSRRRSLAETELGGIEAVWCVRPDVRVKTDRKLE